MNYTITVAPMRDVRVGYRSYIREVLSLGPIEWGAYSWTFNTGETWAALVFDGDEPKLDSFIAWAILTKEIDDKAVVGAYTHPDWRGYGYAAAGVRALLFELRDLKVLAPGETVKAKLDWFPRYKSLAQQCGIKVIQWD